jgi:hypothetical protein
MSIEAARRLIRHLDSRIHEEELGNPFFKDPRVRTYPLAKTGFRPIKLTDLKCKVAFVDGGNQEIVGASDFSAQLNRMYFGLWNCSERILEKTMPRRLEFFSSTSSRFTNDQVYYDTSVFPVHEEQREMLPKETDLTFDSTDRTVTVGNQRADIGRVASIARVFAEWRFAAEIVEQELEKNDVLVMDRTLQTAFKNEHKYLADLVKKANQKGVIVTGLSKTCALFTDTGLSLIGALSKLAEDSGIEQEWYFPIAEIDASDHNAMVLAVRLHRDAKRIFRYEIQRGQFNGLAEEQINGVLTHLVKNSSDLTFPGYPYGLIDADRFARVSMQEVEYYKTLMLSQLSDAEKWEKLSRHVGAKDAHDVLNMLIG